MDHIWHIVEGTATMQVVHNKPVHRIKDESVSPELRSPLKRGEQERKTAQMGINTSILLAKPELCLHLQQIQRKKLSRCV